MQGKPAVCDQNLSRIAAASACSDESRQTPVATRSTCTTLQSCCLTKHMLALIRSARAIPLGGIDGDIRLLRRDSVLAYFEASRSHQLQVEVQIYSSDKLSLPHSEPCTYMEGVIARLESVAARLEKFEGSVQGRLSASSAAPSRSAPSSGTAHAVHTSVSPPSQSKEATQIPGKYEESAWGAFLASEVDACATAAASLPEEFRGSTVQFLSGAKAMVEVIKLSQQRSKPSMEELQSIVQPLADCMQQAESIKDGDRSKASNHHRAISECLQTFAWITFDPAAGAPPPDAVIGEGLGSSEMFINKVIMEFRDSAPEHKVWALSVKALMKRLLALAKLQFPNGLTWTGTGAGPKPGAAVSQPPAAADTAAPDLAADAPKPEAPVPEATPDAAAPEPPVAPESVAATPADDGYESAASTLAPGGDDGDGEEEGAGGGARDAACAEVGQPAEKASAGSGPAPPPPPPPPPPPGMLLEKVKAAGGGGGTGDDSRGALMSALNRGANVTSGLRKVTDDMKTKNQKNRPGVVKAAAAPTKPSAAARGPARKELCQNRWEVENWVACEPVQLQEDELRRSHAIYISNCADCVVQVHGKVNTIMLDGCKKVGLAFGSVVSSVELVNCAGCKVQCDNACPTLNIDKTDGVQVYLSQEAAAATEVVTSKSASMSVTVLAAGADAEPAEHPVPEQFMSKVVDGKLVTVPVSHL
eukprot:jgi/Ulvmu1/1793/UM119_0011.1